MDFQLSPRVALAAGYSRMRQRTQSMRNDESLLDGLFGVPLPVTSRAGGPPAARSDQFSTSMEARLPNRVVVTVDGYVRRLTDLVLVAPFTGQPFAVSDFAVGSGRASGVGVAATHYGDRLSATAAYTIAQTMRRTGAVRYRPGYGVTQQLTVAAAWRLSGGTAVRAALWGTVGRPSSVTAGDFQWVPVPLVSGAGEVAGSPQHFAGPLGSARLPQYWRLDLGIRHEWRPRSLGPLGGITSILSVENVLNRTNVLGATTTSGGFGGYAITLPPRTLIIGLEWGY